MSRALKPCGTPAAYGRHLRHDEDPCKPCREAWCAYQREYAATRAYRSGYRPPCGTTRGYRAHLAHGEKCCAACRSAYNAWHRAYRAARRSA